MTVLSSRYLLRWNPVCSSFPTRDVCFQYLSRRLNPTYDQAFNNLGNLIKVNVYFSTAIDDACNTSVIFPLWLNRWFFKICFFLKNEGLLRDHSLFKGQRQIRRSRSTFGESCRNKVSAEARYNVLFITFISWLSFILSNNQRFDF